MINSDIVYDYNEAGYLYVNKPYNWTSFDTINKIRYFFRYYAGLKSIKIGHSGTLDPLASGVLIICTGKKTKEIENFQNLEKEYTGVFRLGETTPSFDLETDSDAFYDISHITNEAIYATAKQFEGEIMQSAPLYSAKKINGKRAYEYARTGKNIIIPANKIFIKKFEITNIKLPEISFKIICGKGTYIRSLANDYGKALNSGACLIQLCRTRIGEITLKDTKSIDEIEQIIINQYSEKNC